VLHPAYVAPEGGSTLAAIVGPSTLAIQQTREEQGLMGTSTAETVRHEVELPLSGGEATALAVDGRGDGAFVGTSAGRSSTSISRTASRRSSGPFRPAPPAPVSPRSVSHR